MPLFIVLEAAPLMIQDLRTETRRILYLSNKARSRATETRAARGDEIQIRLNPIPVTRPGEFALKICSRKS